MPALLILIVIIVVIAVVVVLLYNGLVQRRLRIDEAYAQIQVQLKRRWDLIPNLVNAVKGYMGFEQSVLTQVTNARASAVTAGAQGPAASAAAENALTSSLRSLFAVVENYPQLKANENVMNLQEQLTTTENQISFSRQHYNATVLDYNTTIQTLPSALLAGPLGFTKREFFEAEEAAQATPTVDLGSYGTAPGAASPGTPAPSIDLGAPPAPPAAPPPAPPAGPAAPPDAPTA
jgi:LemA protein